MSRWAAICALALLAACVGVDSAKESQGQGEKRTFRQPFDVVYQAALNSAQRRKLEVIEQDRVGGRLVLSNAGSWTSVGGERIAVFVTRSGEGSTVVEVVSKAAGGLFAFPPAWPALMLGDIDQELTPRRPQ